MKQILLTILFLLTLVNLSAQIKWMTPEKTQEEKTEEIRQTIGLDYSMPDYSVTTIDAQVMGTHLAQLVEYFCANYNQNLYDNALSLILEQQINGLKYPSIKDLRFKKATKKDNEITMIFDTFLDPNNLNLKRVPLTFTFVDGVSDSKNVNDLFMYMTRYVNVREKK